MIDAADLGLLAMASIGLAGSGHCIGMCGGIASALGLAANPRSGTLLVVGYNLGRILSYAIAGALVAMLGYWGSGFLSIGPWLRIFAGILLVLMGFYVAGWWQALTLLEKGGAKLWNKIQPLGNRLLPVKGFTHAVALGMVWGWLPCGLVYTALAYAATSAEPLRGAMMMMAFGVGTAPLMILGGLLSEQVKKLFQARWMRVFMAVCLVLFGAWTLINATSHLGHMAHKSSQEAPPHSLHSHH
jgi:sulfite exporter TauE/SafE